MVQHLAEYVFVGLLFFSVAMKCYCNQAPAGLHHNVSVFVHRVPLPGMETHIPVLFLNLKRMTVFAKAHYFDLIITTDG